LGEDQSIAGRTRFQVSAGGVIYRLDGEGQIEIVLIAHRSGEPWRLPKGRVEPGETLRAAARREVYEETGVQGEIREALGPIEYWFWWHADGERLRYHKRVYFFLMRPLEGDLTDHGHEVEEVRWFPVNEALALLTYREEQKVIKLARSRIRELSAS
jgi:8-oxo-dGTP pyrophosphatase MutT (NUDIX family)